MGPRGAQGERGKDVNLTTVQQLAFTAEELWRIFTVSSDGIRRAAGPPEVPPGKTNARINLFGQMDWMEFLTKFTIFPHRSV